MKNSINLAIIATIVNLTAPSVLFAKKRLSPQPISAPTLPALGTSDGAGGNGLNNRMFESYIWHPETSEAFKLHLQQLFKAAFGTENDPEGTMVFKIKTWYQIPEPLPAIASDVLGITFDSTGAQQVALQRKYNVQFDKNLFDSMENSEEQARAILHEAMMTYYFVKFMSPAELCERSTTCSGFEKGSPMGDYIESVYSPVAYKKLEASDYENIRTVTAWLYENRANINKKSFDEVAFRHGFDKRFTAPHNSDNINDDNEKVEMTVEQQIISFEKARLSKQLPTQCKNPDSGKQFACSIDWQFIETAPSIEPKITFMQYNVVNLKTHQRIAHSELGIQSHTYFTTGLPNSSVIAYVRTDFSMEDGSAWGPNMKVGTRARTDYWIFTDKGTKLVGMASAPLVYVGATKEIKVNENGQKETCLSNHFARLKEPNGSSQAFVAATMTNVGAYLEFLVKELEGFATGSCTSNQESN